MTSALLAHHAGDTPVSFAGGEQRSADDLLHDAARVAAAFPPAAQAGQILSVVRHDHYALACLLLAAMVRGHTVALPPEIGREAITAIASDPATLLIVHDTPSSAGLKVDALLAAGAPITPITRAELALATLRVRLFARAGHGAVEKRSAADWIARARAAVSTLEFAPGTRVLGTLAPGQPCNIVLGILAPLLSGGAFARTVTKSGTLRDALRGEQPDVLLSVPATLRRLTATDIPPCTRVLSSLAPLPKALVHALGGARLQDVQFSAAEGVAAVRNPDAVLSVTLPPSRALEAFLLALPGVDDAAVVAQPALSAPSYLVAYVGDADRQTLSQALVAAFGADARPRALTRLVRVPRDSTGRYAQADVLRVFRLRPDGSPLNFALEIPAPEPALSADKRRFTLQIPRDYAYFDGHFTGYPILAGAVQLGELVLPCARALWPALRVVRQLTRLKFTGRIQPGETIDLELTLRDTYHVDFVLKRGSTLCASGSLQFVADRADA